MKLHETIWKNLKYAVAPSSNTKDSKLCGLGALWNFTWLRILWRGTGEPIRCNGPPTGRLEGQEVRVRTYMHTYTDRYRHIPRIGCPDMPWCDSERLSGTGALHANQCSWPAMSGRKMSHYVVKRPPGKGKMFASLSWPFHLKIVQAKICTILVSIQTHVSRKKKIYCGSPSLWTIKDNPGEIDPFGCARSKEETACP